MFLCSSTQRTTILRPFVRRTAVNVIGVYAPWIHFRSVKAKEFFEMILSFSIREIENGGEEDATRCVQTICMSCKQDLAQLCGLRVVGLICSVRCKVWKCRVRMVEGAAAGLNCIKNKQHVQSGISAMFKPMCESIHAAILSSSSSTTREAASNLHVMSAAITFLDTTCSRSCVANLLRSNWNSIVRLDRNNEDIVKGSCKLFRKILCVLKKDEAISSGFLSEIIKRISTFPPKPCVLECVST